MRLPTIPETGVGEEFGENEPTADQGIDGILQGLFQIFETCFLSI